MRGSVARLCGAGALLAALAACSERTDLAIVSYNLLCSGCYHNQALYEPWAQRGEHALELLERQDADLIALQELDPPVFADVSARFGDQYAIHPGALEDESPGAAPGHRNIILFRKSRYRFVAGGSFRLAERSDPGSNRVQDAFRRNCTWAILAHRSGDQSQFRIFSCHLPYGSPSQTMVAAQTLAEWMWTSAGLELPQIVVGDFNSGSDSKAMQLLFQKSGSVTGFSYPREFRKLIDPVGEDRIDYVLLDSVALDRLISPAEVAVLGEVPYREQFRRSDHPLILVRGNRPGS